VRLESLILLDIFDDYPFALLEGIVSVLLEVGVEGAPFLDTPAAFFDGASRRRFWFLMQSRPWEITR
jgi:hypothetical protein